MTETLLTPAQAARILGVTPKRVQQLADAGWLPSRRSEQGWRMIPITAVLDRAKARPKPTTPPGYGMLVATETFVATYDGVDQQVIAGVTHIDADHEIVKRFPDRFAKRGAPRALAAVRATASHPKRRQSQPNYWFVGPSKTTPADVNPDTLNEWDRARRKHVARHEAGHACKALALGWRVSHVQVDAPEDGGGFVQFQEPRGYNRARFLRERAVIAAAGEIGGRVEFNTRRGH
jgi:hypothetical protein